jgi:hypothetical protein
MSGIITWAEKLIILQEAAPKKNYKFLTGCLAEKRGSV